MYLTVYLLHSQKTAALLLLSELILHGRYLFTDRGVAVAAAPATGAAGQGAHLVPGVARIGRAPGRHRPKGAAPGAETAIRGRDLAAVLPLPRRTAHPTTTIS